MPMRKYVPNDRDREIVLRMAAIQRLQPARHSVAGPSNPRTGALIGLVPILAARANGVTNPEPRYSTYSVGRRGGSRGRKASNPTHRGGLPVTCHMLRHSPSHMRRPILGASVTSHVTPPYKV